MARAANGDLTLGNCVKSAAPGGSCTLPASTVTDFDVVLGIAAAANGRDIYVTSNTGRSVLHFVQAPGGDISFADCVSEAGNAPCDAVGTGRLNQVVGVDVSDDGRSVYTGAAGTSNALARFDVLAGGALNLTFCFSQSGVNCGSPSAPNSLAGARGVDVTPDGRNVYVAGGTGNAMSIWNRTPDTGFISFGGCFGQATTGCTDLSPTVALTAANDVVVAPNGANVYVTGRGANALANFRRQVPPVCGNGTSVARQGVTTSVPLDCSDPNGDAVTRVIVAAPAHGVLGPVDQATGAVGYTPAPGYVGADSFTFEATDSGGDSNVAAAQLTVTPASAPSVLAALSSLSVRPSKFRARGSGGTLFRLQAAKKKRAPLGTTVRYVLNVADSVNFTVQKPGKGHKVGRRCKSGAPKKPKKGRHRAKACTLIKSVGSFTHAGAAGANAFRFSGRVRGRKLGPSGYRLVGVPAGRPASAALRAKFTIVR